MSDFEAITGIPIEAILGSTKRLVVVKRCPSCGEHVEPGWTFCGSCGADLPVAKPVTGEMDGYEPADSHSGPFKTLDQYQSQLRAKRKRVKR